MKRMLLGEVTGSVKTWNPSREPEKPFTYLDLSSVDNQTKRIVNPVVMAGREAPSRARQLVRAGDVLVSTVRPNLNAVAVVDDHFDGATASTGFTVLRPHHVLDTRYLFHWVRSTRFIADMVRKATGASYPAVSDRIIKESAVPLPGLDEQRHIAGTLDHVDGLRARRLQVDRKWEQLASAVFDDVIGDPVSNPKGWPVHSFGELTSSMQYGPRFYNESYSTEGVRIVRITDLSRSGQLDFASMPRMAVTEDETTRYGLTAGDIIFARTGATVGKLARIRPSDPPCIAGAYFIRLQLKDCLEPAFAEAFLRTRSIQSIIEAGSHQSAQQNFSGPGLRALPCPLPPKELQRQLGEYLARLENSRAAGARAAVSLDELLAALQSRTLR